MHLICGKSKNNEREPRKSYEQRFPTRHIQSHPTFSVFIDSCEKSVRFPSQTGVRYVHAMHERQK